MIIHFNILQITMAFVFNLNLLILGLNLVHTSVLTVPLQPPKHVADKNYRKATRLMEASEKYVSTESLHQPHTFNIDRIAGEMLKMNFARSKKSVCVVCFLMMKNNGRWLQTYNHEAFDNLINNAKRIRAQKKP